MMLFGYNNLIKQWIFFYWRMLLLQIVKQRYQNAINLIQMSLIYSDTIYEDLKEQGLIFSSPITIDVPESPPISRGVISKFISAFKSSQDKNIQFPILTHHISNTAFVVARQQMLYLYKIQLSEQNQSLSCSHIQTLTLTNGALSIHICKCRQERTKVPILIKNKEGFELLVFDIKETQLQNKGSIRQHNIKGVEWINERQFMIIKEKQFVHYILSEDRAIKKKQQNLQLKIEEDQTIKDIWITDIADDNKQSLIVIFYGVVKNNEIKESKNDAIPMSLRIKQIFRTIEGQLIFYQDSDYVIESNNIKYRPSFFISNVGDYYCLQVKNQILIVKKKFDKYMLIDVMSEKISGYSVRLCTRGLALSIGEKMVQLNSLQFSDPKCATKIFDVIQFSPELEGIALNFQELWPYLWKKQHTLIFVFLLNNKITLCNLIKMKPMLKLRKLVEADQKNKKPLKMIRDMGKNLGICQKDFYLNLWLFSSKQNRDIDKFLIPCNDVDSIKKQIGSLMRRRTISVSEMLKISDKIGAIIKQNLNNELNQKNIREYVQNDFLRRKLKLNHMHYSLDHRIFNKIYSTSLLDLFDNLVSAKLDPKQIITDPLHPECVEEIQNQGFSLERVFQEFKVELLQDYKNFLRQFFKKFPNKILDVLRHFNFLLPNYPFQIKVQRPSKINAFILKDPNQNCNQNLWFQEITLQQWNAAITKEKIKKSLLDKYPTSKIIETITQFSDSIDGKRIKLWKHGLIELSLEQYAQKLSELNGIQLYLDLCQLANQLAVEKGTAPIGKQIIKILSQKNKLREPDIHNCNFFASLHYFMLKNEIVSAQKLQMSYLTKLKPQNLVALFFLQNKLKKQYVFNQFKDLFEDKNEFKQVLKSFVQSQNCSCIELKILMLQILNKGNQNGYQQKNQDLIELLIDGVCKKVQIIQDIIFLELEEEEYLDQEGVIVETKKSRKIDDLFLSKDLTFKITRIIQLKKCQNIFTCFGLEKMTFGQLLEEEKNNRIYKILLEKFFQLKTNDSNEDIIVLLDDKQEVINAKSMLMVLIYLQERVYFSTNQFQLLILYCLEMIQWKQFEIIKEILCQNSFLQSIGTNSEQLLKVLIQKALQGIHLQPEIVYDQQTKEQIINILNIDENISSLKIKQLAKIEFAQIFQSWGFEIKTLEMYELLEQWRDNKFVIVNFLITNYINNLSFIKFRQIYELLQKIDQQTNQLLLDDKQFYIFAKQYAYALLSKERYREIIDILIYIIEMSKQQIDFVLLTETVVKCILEKYPQDLNLARHNIEYYVEKYVKQEIEDIKQLICANFQPKITQNWKPQQDIFIHDKRYVCSSQIQCCSLSLQEIWKIANKQFSFKGTKMQDSTPTKIDKTEKKNYNPQETFKQQQQNQQLTNQQICYNYLFLLLGLNKPKLGFSNLYNISYNLEKTTNIVLIGLQNQIETNPDFEMINYKSFLEIYLQGLRRYGQNILKQHKQKENETDKNQQNDESLMKKSYHQGEIRNISVQKILKQLRKYKNVYPKLYYSLYKVNLQLNDKAKMKQRKERIHQKMSSSKNKNKSILKKISKISVFEEKEEENLQPQKQVFINWRKIEEERQAIKTKSLNTVCQREIIDQIYDSIIANNTLNDSYYLSNQKQMGSVFKSILPMMNEQKNIKIIKQMIYNNEGTKITNYQSSSIAEAFNQIYFDPRIDFYRVLHLMESSKIGDQNKLKIALMTKVFKENLSNQFIKRIFPFSFLKRHIYCDSKKQLFSKIFEEIRPLINQQIPSLEFENVKVLGNLIKNVLQSDEYSSWFYYDVISWIGSSLKFDSSSVVILIEDCINRIEQQCPDILSTNYQQLLKAITKDKDMKIFIQKLLQKVFQRRNQIPSNPEVE